MKETERELLALIKHGKEERNLEFKGTIPWTNAKFKLAKAALAMSNIRDGGSFVIGVRDDGEPAGMDQADSTLTRYRYTSTSTRTLPSR